MTLPPYIQTALDRLNARGYSAYVVGGSVRDSILGLAPTDFDLTTSALPEQIKDCFSGYRQFYAGIKHGTVSVVIDKNVVEITTFRIDGDYSDNRRPEQVVFTDDLQADLARRDFTINAMAFHPKTGICDFFGGREDLSAGLIRCIDESRTRFEEDALRIMRALRFSAALGFEIEPDTQQGMSDCAELLKNISKERIVFELKKIICAPHAARVLDRYFYIIRTVIPQLEPPDTGLFCGADHVCVRLAFLLLGCTEPAGLLAEMGFDNKTKALVLYLLDHRDIALTPDRVFVKRQLRRVAPPDFYQLVRFKGRIDRADYSAVWAAAEEIIKNGECYTLPQLAVDGRDIMALGLYKDKQIGKALDLLLEQVIQGLIENKKAALIAAAKKLDLSV